MILTIIIVIIAYVLIKFLLSLNKQKEEMSKQGGVKVKYRLLIEFFLAGDGRSKIINETTTSMLIRSSSIGGYTSIHLFQAYDDVVIEWETDGALGKHKKRWEFNQNMNQETMIYTINSEMEVYNKKIISQLYDGKLS